jgi:hypothetical protein
MADPKVVSEWITYSLTFLNRCVIEAAELCKSRRPKLLEVRGLNILIFILQPQTSNLKPPKARGHKPPTAEGLIFLTSLPS